MNENEHPDHLSLTRLLQQAKLLMEPMFDDQKEKWVVESPLGQEICAILVKHPEYCDEVRAQLCAILPKPF